MSSTLKVFGLTMGSVLIEDIQVTVPFHEIIAIPADKAYASKDLWRAVSQRKIFHLNASATLPPATPPAISSVQASDSQAVIEKMSEQIEKLTDMLQQQSLLIQKLSERPVQVVSAPAQQVVAQTETTKTVTKSVVEDAPMYIPSVVKPDVQEQRIQGETTTQESGNLASTRDQLRAMRLRKKHNDK